MEALYTRFMEVAPKHTKNSIQSDRQFHALLGEYINALRRRPTTEANIEFICSRIVVLRFIMEDLEYLMQNRNQSIPAVDTSSGGGIV